MSEQTPDTTGDFDGDVMIGSSDENEPSMEDILASIRKIISEDGDPVPLDGPEVNAPSAQSGGSKESDPSGTVEPIAFPRHDREAAADNNAVNLSVETVSEPISNSVSDNGSDSDDFDIDALLNDIAMSEPDVPPLSIPAIEMDDEPMALDIPMIPEDDTPATSASANMPDDETDDDFLERILGSDSADLDSAGHGESDDPLIDMLLSQDLTTPDADAGSIETDRLSFQDEDDQGDTDFSIAEASSSPDVIQRPSIDTGDDLDLVKSLMADLTDADEDPSETEATSYQGTDEVMNDILDMAIDDEILRGPSLEVPTEEISSGLEIDPADEIDALAEALIEKSGVDADDAAANVGSAIEDFATPEIAPEPIHEPTSEPAKDETSFRQSLAEIAAAAEADAKASESRRSVLSENAVAAASATIASHDSDGDEAALDALSEGGDLDRPTNQPMVQSSSTSSSADADADGLGLPDSPTPGLNPEKETPMPSAVRHDVILDDITEEATMSAFAELNNMVEERTVLEERGPRIGDLVQEALKPMLREWLEENLQGIVERAVAKEVKRIANGK